jgi:hypothetical protein
VDATERLESRLVLNPNPKLALTAVLVDAAVQLRSDRATS